MATTYQQPRPLTEAGMRAEDLIGRYPNLGEQELAELINLFPHLRLMDQGRIILDEGLAGKLGRFHRDHGDKLKPRKTELVVFLAFPVMLGLYGLWSLLG